MTSSTDPLLKKEIIKYDKDDTWHDDDIFEHHYLIKNLNKEFQNKYYSRYNFDYFNLIFGLVYQQHSNFTFAEKQFSKLKNDYLKPLKNSTMGRLLVFIEMGFAPYKKQKNYSISVHNKRYNIKIPFYVKKRFLIRKCEIILNRKSMGFSKLVFDLEDFILRDYKHFRKHLIVNTAKKYLKTYPHSSIKNISKGKDFYTDKASKAKGIIQKNPKTVVKSSKNIIRYYKRKARRYKNHSKYGDEVDLRSWKSLPAYVHIFRIHKLSSGKHQIQLKFYDQNNLLIEQTKTKKIFINEFKNNYLHFRSVN